MIQFNLDNYEDLIELKIDVTSELFKNLNYNWKKYNPRKDINRWGCSITSLDGNDSGIPDIDSLIEYNQLNETNYKETDFKIPTVHSTPFKSFLSTWDVARSHYLKLDSGGFFPWHRDSDKQTFRLIYTIENCVQGHFIWLHDDTPFKLTDHKWYFINTKKKHCLFSFNTVIFAVFNVEYTAKNLKLLYDSFVIK